MNFTDSELKDSKANQSALTPETSISRSTFRNLPLDIQREYARVHGLPGFKTLTTDEICSGVFNESDWTPALEIEGHVRLVTSEGVVVAKEVMDLVDWLVEHQKDATLLGEQTDNPTHVELEPGRDSSIFLDGTNDRAFDENLEEAALELQRAHARLKLAADKSQQAAREAYADLFVVQSHLAEEQTLHGKLVEAIMKIVGPDMIQELQEQLDVAEKEGHLGSIRGKRRPSASNRDTRSIRNIYLAVPIQYDNPNQCVEASSTTPSITVGSKRNREDEESLEEFHRRRRPRLGTITHAPTAPRQTILNYSSHEESTDDTYSDSNGTERDFLDDPYIPPRPIWERFLPHADSSPEGSYEEDIDKEETDIDSLPEGTAWGTLSSDFFNDDSSDSDYQPPSWTLEDVWELEHERNDQTPRHASIHPLFQLRYAKELSHWDGFMSDGGLSTDDPDDGYHVPEFLERPRSPYRRQDFPASLSPHLKQHDFTKREFYGSDVDDNEFELHKRENFRRLRLRKWDIVWDRLLKGTFRQLDVEQRLADVLEPDHALFVFDDEEWKRFADPRSYRSTCVYDGAEIAHS